ncbi:uncharacterized protein CMU_023050 [Cryptosporidium muris RN66]|uniref:Uncharacterized protein n=1 Tax=Cryptosporidium muris (strain RN66) TaxID=441375 RepID=B6ABU7_CRYMR|nr:uncharacterized protein CMU_023050 [Cryptosporidium muris RN66]EEA05300.1 hypothetical protein, conserved [Cryptosporidium muris RN66]|eukprot:XP_002139649.1 hypothetical protein [Cryptosporidium muris RN66]
MDIGQWGCSHEVYEGGCGTAKKWKRRKWETKISSAIILILLLAVTSRICLYQFIMSSRLGILFFLLLLISSFTSVLKINAEEFSSEERLKECERELKSLVRHHGDCSSKLESMRSEVKHLFESAEKYERKLSQCTSKTDETVIITWRTIKHYLYHYSKLLRTLFVICYHKLPVEFHQQLTLLCKYSRKYLKPFTDKCGEFSPKIINTLRAYAGHYVVFLEPYTEYAHFCGAMLNERIDNLVLNIEDIHPELIDTIPKELHDRLLYIVFSILVLFMAWKVIYCILRRAFGCCRFGCCVRSGVRPTSKPSSTKATPSGRRR